MLDRRRPGAGARTLVAAVLCALPALAAALELNSANRAELEQVNGIGVAVAERILVERERRGAFSDWSDFARRVPGFRARALDRLAQQGVTINGETRTPAVDAPPARGGASGGTASSNPRGPAGPSAP